jgi:ribosome recycling factor
MSAAERLSASVREADDEMRALVSKTKVELAKIPLGIARMDLLYGLSVESSSSNGKSTPIDQTTTTVAIFADQSAREITTRDPGLMPKIRALLENTEDLAATCQRSGGLRIDFCAEPLVDEQQQRLNLQKVRTEIKTGQRGIRAVRKNIVETLDELLADGLPAGEVLSARQDLQQGAENHIEELDEALRELLRLVYATPSHEGS